MGQHLFEKISMMKGTQSNMIRCRKICQDEHEERIKRKKCPNCGNVLFKNFETKDINISKKYKIVDYVWLCNSIEKEECFFISSGEDEKYFELSSAPMINFNEEYNSSVQYSSKILRRRNGEITFLAK